MKTYAILAAGGTGSRFGADIPKQYMQISGIPVFIYSLMAFEKSTVIDGIIISADKSYHEYIEDLCNKYKISKLVAVTPNGKERRDSVYQALMLAENKCDVVLIHDAARPLLPLDVIERAVKDAAEYGAVATVIPSSDTILVSEDGNYADYTPDRKTLYAMQTPQGFITADILKAHREIPSDAIITDDCSMIRYLGGKVRLINGNEKLIKLTKPSDFDIISLFAEQYLLELNK